MMQYSDYGNRFSNTIPDWAILFFALHIIAFSYVFSTEAIDCGGAEWVVVLEMIVMPGWAFVHFYSDSDVGGFLYYMLYVLLFFAETLYYIFIDIGHRVTKTDICNIDGTKPSILKIIVRSCMKTFSRYLFMIPFLMIFITDRNQTLHDIIAETVVVDRIAENK